MKKIFCATLAVVMSFSFAFHAMASEETLISLNDFTLSFNLLSVLSGTNYALSLDNADELTSFRDYVLFKTIYNGNIILSLDLTKDKKDVKDIHCTLAETYNTSQSDVDDFLSLLWEVLFTCGMESESISSVFASFAQSGTFQDGDSGEISMDGIKVSYEAGSYYVVSFVIEKADKDIPGKSDQKVGKNVQDKPTQKPEPFVKYHASMFDDVKICRFGSLTITAEGASVKLSEWNDHLELIIPVVIENKNGSIDYGGHVNCMSVNGWEVDPIFSFEIRHKLKERNEIIAYIDDIGIDSLDDVETVTFKFMVDVGNKQEKLMVSDEVTLEKK